MFSDSLPQVGRSTRAARRRGHEGVLPVDTAPTVSAIARGTPRCKFRRSWFLRRNSSERLGAAIFKIRVDALADSGRTKQRPVRLVTLPSRHLDCAVEGVGVAGVVLGWPGGSWQAGLHGRRLPPALLPARRADWP